MQSRNLAYFPAMIVSHQTLRILAALLWYSGVLILYSKGGSLAQDAYELEPERFGKWIGWSAGVVLGIIKTKYIFLRANRKNLSRITALVAPRIWQFYRPRFFMFLTSMMILGRFLSWAAQGNHGFLVAVTILDISIGTALLLSSIEFWKQGVFRLRHAERS